MYLVRASGLNSFQHIPRLSTTLRACAGKEHWPPPQKPAVLRLEIGVLFRRRLDLLRTFRIGRKLVQWRAMKRVAVVLGLSVTVWAQLPDNELLRADFTTVRFNAGAKLTGQKF